MKASMYVTYPARSLFRGGQRTILAVFCVTVGVMAVVALQLVGNMLQNSLSTNARTANGGDIAVSAPGSPLKPADLTFFNKLKQDGTITGYTAIAGASGTLNNGSSVSNAFTFEAIDPNNFPLVSTPAFVTPGSGTMTRLLTGNQAVVSQNFLATYHKQVNDTFPVYVRTASGTGRTVNVRIVGVIANTGAFAQSGNLLLVSAPEYLTSVPTSTASYTLVDVTTANQAHTDAAVKAINAKFSLVDTQTATNVLKGQQSTIDLVTKFLEIAGLVALLIGGVGVINTMQVLLSRRKTEIAMLKTSGYHRRDLYLLFGLEAGLLGLIGGVIGAVAAMGVSYLIRNLLQSFGTNVPFVLDPGMIIGGVLVGCLTALIFGLLPIVQAANIRPLNVLRELDNKSVSGRLITILLLILFSLLFCLLAIFLLNGNIALGIEVTYGAFAFLLLLSGLFALVLLVVSKLPVPEHLNLLHSLLVLLGVAAAVGVYQFLPVFSFFLLAMALLGLLITFLPRSWKVNVKMALRNLGRRRARTTATVLALFIGVYGIGLDIGMAQDLGNQITGALNKNSPYNLVATTSGNDSATLQAHLGSIPGRTASRTDPYAITRPIAIDGQPTQQVLTNASNRQMGLSLLGGIEGYDLAHIRPAQTIIHGRNLNASDASANNVLVSQVMTSQGWASMNLKVGDTVTFSSLDGKTTRTVHIVGIISVPTSYETLGKVLAPSALVNTLDATNTQKTNVFYMKISPDKVSQALSKLNQVVPNASVQNLSDAAVSFLQTVDSMMNVVVAVASLSMIAAIIIIANSVALALLERRREMGILKSVGYTSGTILSQVLIENGIAAGLGAFIATLLAAGGVVIGSKFFFNNSMTLNMEPIVTVSLIILPTLLAIITAVLVAWNAVRVRPLSVLKYE